MTLPAAQAFCLYAAACEAEGQPLPGPSLAERDLLKTLRQSP